MKKILPIIFSFLLFFTLISRPVFADTASIQAGAIPTPVEGQWYKDPEVTFVGKNAARSGQLLDWTLQDYKWMSMNGIGKNPLLPFWATIRNIVYALLLLVVLVTAFILIITRGKSITIRRFVPRFLAMILFVTFSYAVIEFLYQVSDILQEFFLKPGGTLISQKDLFFWSWDYQSFKGYRIFGDNFTESAYVSLLLVKLSALTYYVMIAILVLRKIILWFFIIISPIFGLLLMYYPLRNTAKIWVGEFFRWLLYAPLFAMFLGGLVSVWRIGIPLFFQFHKTGSTAGVNSIYPSAINIVLGGPGQIISQQNSINLPDTFALYIAALIMLWLVIIVPFILLQIFLDNMMSFATSDSPLYKQMRALVNNKFPPPPPPITPPPGQDNPAGSGKTLQFPKFSFTMPQTTTKGQEKAIPRQQPVITARVLSKPAFNRETEEIARLAKVQIPTLHDIAHFETKSISSGVPIELARMQENLRKIANPTSITDSSQQKYYSQIRSKLVSASTSGNSFATSVLNAASMVSLSDNATTNISNETIQNFVSYITNPQQTEKSLDREKVSAVKESILSLAKQGNPLASTIISNSGIAKATSLVDTNTITSLLTSISSQDHIASNSEKTFYKELREKIIEKSASGNPLATLLLSAVKTLSQQKTDTATITNLKNTMVTESQKGNSLAASLLSSTSPKLSPMEITKLKEHFEQSQKEHESTVGVITNFLKVQAENETTTLQKILRFVDNPELVDDKVQREQIAQVKELLVTENQKSNPLAQTLLMATRTHPGLLKTMHLQQMIQQEEKNNNPVAQAIHDAIQTVHIESKDSLREVLRFIDNPSLISSSSLKEKYTELKETLEREEHAGNELAQTILITSKVSEKKEEVEKLESMLKQELITNNPLASQVLSLASIISEVTEDDIRNIVEGIANIALFPEREQKSYSDLKTQLIKEHDSGSQLAGVILSAVENISQVQNSQVETLLKIIGNPNSAVSDPEKQQYRLFQAQLTKESEKGNMLATTILQESKKYSEVVDVMRIKEELVKAQKNNDPLAVAILTSSTNKLTDTNVSQIKEQLKKAKEKNDPLATSILSVVKDISLSSAIAEKSVPFPGENRIQSVSIEDYEAIKKMWYENYHNLDVPKSIKNPHAGRKQWLEEDMQTIDETINLLSSANKKEVAAGMSKVSQLLPFLLIGGFSQTEIVAYLKAKQEAAKTVYQEVSKEDEDTFIDVRKATTATPKVLQTATTASITDTRTEYADTKTSDSLIRSQQTTFTVPQVGSQQISQKTIISPVSEIENEIMNTLKLQIPSLKEIVVLDALPLIKDEKGTQLYQQIENSLTSIAQPEQIASTQERETYQSVKDKLVTESIKGGVLSNAILSAAKTISSPQDEHEEILQVLKQIVDPEQVIDPILREQFMQMREHIEKSDEKTDSLTHDLKEFITHKTSSTGSPQFTILVQNLIVEKAKGNPLARMILSFKVKPAISKQKPVLFPQKNRIQSVSLDDYEAIKKMWLENYLKAQPPLDGNGKQMSRLEWLKQEIKEITETINLLTSNDPEKVKQGMKKVERLLPFLLIGGFTFDEIVSYLKAKLEAAKTALLEIEKEDDEEATLLPRKETKDLPNQNKKEETIDEQ